MAIFSFQPTAASAALLAPLVVVVPVYNEQETIGQVAEEWSQVFKDLGIDYQINLVNDGSKDGALAVLDGLQRRGPERIVVIVKPNAANAQVAGLACAEKVKRRHVGEFEKVLRFLR
jgi:glycosyltransferase involved in cell wall biosynthesis